MAIDQQQARHQDFFREILRSNNNNNNNTPIQMTNNLYSSTNNSNITNSLGLGLAGAVLPAPSTTVNESLVLPFYSLNDVVFHQLAGAGKLTPAVKDDSGLTFNNSLVPPTTTPASRKRPREPAVLPAPPITLTTTPSCNIVNKESISNGFSFLGEDFSFQIMQQQLELDRLISQHMEKMRVEIEERKKQQLRRIMAAIEEAISKRVRDKEEEMEKIGKINWALEERVKSLCIENQIWRDLAQTNEATANALKSNLEQVLQQVNDNMVNCRTAGELTDDAVSCCGSCGEEEEEEREREVEEDTEGWRKVARRRKTVAAGEDGKSWSYCGKKEEEEEGKRLCRKCGVGESSVLLLPCRHLCLCTSCGPVVNACPICNSAKNASVHVNLS